jgi:glycosyltransferase involved in cell wall biosynthesis
LNILIIHEIDWKKKVIFEPHYLSEIFSLNGHDVYVIDCQEPDYKSLFNKLQTTTEKNYHRIYSKASITLIHPPAILIKGLNRLTSFFTSKKVIKKIIQEKNIDIILLYSTATSGIQTINLSKSFEIPVIFRMLDLSYSLVKIPLLRQITKKLEKNVIINATKIFTINPDLSRYATETGSLQKNVEVFPLGVDIKSFKILPKNQQICNELKIKNNEIVITFVGTLFDFVGLKKIIENFDLILKNSPNTKMLIIGGGSNFNFLNSLIKKKNLDSKIIMTGFVPKKSLPDYLSISNICIQPFEKNETTNRIIPSKILEYFACGKPVLSTPLDGTKEILPDEDYGIVYAESKDFVNVLSKLILDLSYLERLGKNGHKYVIKNHDWSVLSVELIEKLNSIRKTQNIL